MTAKRTSLRLVLTASILLIPGLLPAAGQDKDDEQARKGRVETCVYLKAEQFVWKEFDGGTRLLKESGPRFGLGIFRHYEKNRLTFRPMAEVYGGSVDYDGQTQGGTPVATDTNYVGGKIGFDAGGVVTPGSAIRLEPFAGVRVEYWDRDIESTADAIGYSERWESATLRGGLRGETGPGWGRRVRLFGEAALQWPFSAANRANFPFIGKVKVRPDGMLGWSAEAGMKTGPVRVALFYEAVRFSKSEPVVIPLGGGSALLLLQPDSDYYVYGLSAGWLF